MTRKKRAQSTDTSTKSAINTVRAEVEKQVTNYAKVKVIAMHLLRSTTVDKPKRGTDLLASARKLFPEIVGSSRGMIPDTTFQQSLSALVRDPNARIARRDGQHGYYLIPTDQLPEESIGQKQKRQQHVLEKELYPVVMSWLENEQRYQSVLDVSRKKKNGYWGNPDVLGVNVTSILNTTNVEICTVEVKRNDVAWEKNIHEAISHRRFSNRTFFAMMVEPGQVAKYSEAIEPYCDYYGIGLILLMPDEEGIYIVKNAKTNHEMRLTIKLVHYARHQFVIPKQQAVYLEKMSIKIVSGLVGAGTSNEGNESAFAQRV